MKKRQHTENTNRRGTALVETAFVLPILVMVTMGIVEFGRAMMVAQLVTNAAREGTRLGIVDGSTNASVTASIQDFLQQAANLQSGDLTITITVTPAEGNPDPGNEIGNAQRRDLVSIRVAVPFDKVSYVAGNYLKGKNISGHSAMRHE